MSKPSRDNQSYYDEFSDWYEKERHDGYHALIDDLETDLLMEHVPNKRVLEVGCGTGLILRNVDRVASHAVGIDISPGMLELATERGLDVVHGDATALPFDDNTFDVVYSFKVLAHVQDIDRALREMVRVTRRGGVLLLEFYNRFSLRYLAKRLGGPQQISNDTDEGAIFTRWDSPIDLVRRLPENVELLDWAGVRVLTPLARAHRVPVVKSLLARAEFRARDSLLKYFGGFLVVILEKELA
jgi:ubiquinone/menaquinone biosynthesis C-methylase UbiE